MDDTRYKIVRISLAPEHDVTGSLDYPIVLRDELTGEMLAGTVFVSPKDASNAVEMFDRIFKPSLAA